jgi:FXSXX-COOH protein
VDDISTDHDAPVEHISAMLDVTTIPLADLAILDRTVLAYAIRDIQENSTSEAISGFSSIIW